MERTTKAQLTAMVLQLNQKLNRPLVAWSKGTTGRLKSNPGHLMLDHNSCYGGYQLVEIDNESGGERTHFSGHRFSAGEMWWMLYAVREIVMHGQFEAFPKPATTKPQPEAYGLDMLGEGEQ